MTDKKEPKQQQGEPEEVLPVDDVAQEKLEAETEATEVARQKLDGAREKLAQGLSGFEQTLQQAKTGAGRTSQQMREKAQQASAAAREKAQHASEVARERYVSTKENLRVGYDKVQKDMTQLGHDVNDYVQANPGKSVLIAAGLGFVVGLLLRGRSRD